VSLSGVLSGHSRALRVIRRLGLTKLASVMHRMAGAAAWTVAAAGFSRGAGLVYAIIIARLIGKEEAGEFAMVQNTGTLLLTLTGSGLHTIAAKELAQRDEVGRATAPVIASITRAAWLAGLAGCLALVLAGDWIVTALFGAANLASATRFGGGLIVLFGTLLAARTGALLGMNRFRSIALSHLVTGVFGLLGVWSGAMLAGVTGAAIGLGASSAVGYVVLQKAISVAGRSQRGPLESEKSRELARSLAMLGLCYGIYAAGNWFAMSSLARSSHGFADVALFAVANQWQTAILFVPSALSFVLLPRLSGLIGRGDRGMFRDTFAATLVVNVLLAVVGILVVVLLAPAILALYGPAFRGGEPTVYAMAIASIPVTVANLTSQALFAKGMMRASALAQMTYGVAIVALAAWLIPAAGAFGLAVATAGAHCCLALGNALALTAANREGSSRRSNARYGAGPHE